MRVHAIWLSDSFVMAFWAEATASTGLPSTNGRRQNAFSSYPLHPAAVPSDVLMPRLPRRLELFEEQSVFVLPSSNGKPVSSQDTVPPSSPLRPWSVPTGQSIADCVVDCLLNGDFDEELPEGMEWSSTMAFWQAVASFALVLHDQQSYVPGVAGVEGRHYPLWRVAFTEESERYWERLRACMPSVCRSAVPTQSQTESQEPPDPALSFLDACVDHLVRQRRLRRFAKLTTRKRNSSPVYRQWLNSIRSGQFSYLDGAAIDLGRFANEVEAWSQYLRPAAPNHPLRLALDLEPPAREEGPWRLVFGLRSLKNPAMKLTADQIWSDVDGATLDRYFPGAREALLAGLGVAKEMFPPLAQSLEGLRPTGCELTREQACTFMTETVPLLRRVGLAVNLPDWWEGRDPDNGVRLRMLARTSATQDRQPLLGVSQLVDYRWEIALGDQALSQSEFMDLANSEQPLVFHRGRWVRVDVKALRQTLRFLRDKGDTGQVTLGEALQLSTELHGAGGLTVSEFRMESESGEAFAAMEAGRDFEELEPPPGFVGQLRPYQLKGYSWMVFVRGLNFGACLADDMGLGKTIQMIAALLYDAQHADHNDPALIVAPMSVVGNWVKEFQRFAPEVRVMVHHGQDRNDRQAFMEALKHHEIVISTYNLVVRDKAIFQACKWGSIVLDEAQNIKNPSTKQALAIRSLRAYNRFCLTGTPVENRLTELWSLMDFLNPGYLGSLSFFRSYFSLPIERDTDEARAALLQRMIRPFILRRLKSDRNIIRDLPDKQEMKVYCNLTTEQAALYQMVVSEMLKRINGTEGMERKGLVLSTLTKLKQITNHPRHFLRDDTAFASARSGKLQRLEEMIEVVLEEKEKALIFTQFTELGDLLRKKLQERFGAEVLYMHGGTPKMRRDEMVTRFQRAGGPPLFLLSLKAGGLGLNLTAATHVFHFDRWWNPAVEDQATDRAYRIGQTRNVQVHKFICIGTVEEKIDQMIEEKKNLASQIVTVGEAMLTELSTDQLREIFALTSDAVIE